MYLREEGERVSTSHKSTKKGAVSSVRLLKNYGKRSSVSRMLISIIVSRATLSVVVENEQKKER